MWVCHNLPEANSTIITRQDMSHTLPTSKPTNQGSIFTLYRDPSKKGKTLTQQCYLLPVHTLTAKEPPTSP